VVSVESADINRIFTDLAESSQALAEQWLSFLKKNNFDFSMINRIEVAGSAPVIYDRDGRKFQIDFMNDSRNYRRKKSGLKKELISRALGGGRFGLDVLDLSAGLGIDSVFLTQLGYRVTALERHPLIYLCLQQALEQCPNSALKFMHADAAQFLKSQPGPFRVIYFDPMFPDKKKSALPKQEMVFFREMVGDDADAQEVLHAALSAVGVERIVVKRPVSAPVLFGQPQSVFEGKLVRFDVYGVKNEKNR